MKTVIIYYSYTGTTKKYVEKMKELIDCDLVEIKPKKDIKSKGFASYITGGFQSMKKESPELMDYDFKRDDYDFFIFASPVWAYTYAPALRSFFEREEIKNKKVSYFYTHKGGPGKTKKRFEELLSSNEIIEGFDINAYDDERENLKKVEWWIQKIYEQKSI